MKGRRREREHNTLSLASLSLTNLPPCEERHTSFVLSPHHLTPSSHRLSLPFSSTASRHSGLALLHAYARGRYWFSLSYLPHLPCVHVMGWRNRASLSRTMERMSITMRGDTPFTALFLPASSSAASTFAL